MFLFAVYKNNKTQSQILKYHPELKGGFFRGGGGGGELRGEFSRNCLQIEHLSLV